MHISAMWAFNPGGQNRGVNVVAYRNPSALDEHPDIIAILANATKNDIIAHRYELRPGGNRLEASLDLIFDDNAFDPAEIMKQLNDIEKHDFRKYDPVKPLIFQRRLGRWPMYGVFDVYTGPHSIGGARAVFSMLSRMNALFFRENPDLKSRPAA